jgi:hypothetical protein
VDDNGSIINNKYDGVSISFNDFLDLMKLPEPEYLFEKKSPEEASVYNNSFVERSPKSIRFNLFPKGPFVYNTI